MQYFLTSLISPFVSMARAVAPLAVAATLALPATPSLAQGLFSPAIKVNQGIITRYELEQRALMMEVLRIPGDPQKDSREALIDEQLRRQLIDQAGFSVAPEDVQLGVDEFASRGGLTTEEFLDALAEFGVSAETVRDFIEVQLAWRDYISARYLSQARPTDDEIDRALGQSNSGGLQVLLSELIIPVTPQTLDQVDELAAQIAGLESYDAFAAAAQQYSASETKTNGGKMPWLNLTELPPVLQSLVLNLKPGEITAPISLPNAVALFQMRGIREIAGGTPRYSAIDYAQYLIAGGRSAEALQAAAEISQRIDTCDDLYGVAKGQSPQVLDRISAKPSEIPRDVALELAKLDPGEVSYNLTRNNGQTLVLLMLCSRTRDTGGEQSSREEVANALAQQRLQAFADSLLSQQRAEAIIVEQ